ncbi:MAG: mechanosensitive ion channel [Planctomycetales bacterium]|nr:mechanosensitive ion channel [Planctomycetales bacterium]
MQSCRIAILTSILVASSVVNGAETLSMQGPVVPASFTENPAQVEAAPAVAVTKETIESEHASILAAELSDAQKTEFDGRLNKASVSLQVAEEDGKRSAAFDTQTKAIPEQLEKLRANMATKLDVTDVPLAVDATVAQLESQLAQLRQHVAAIETEFNAKNKELESRPTRIQEITKESIELQKKITAAAEQQQKSPPADLDGRTKWFEASARYSALQKTFDRLQAERRYLDGATELLPLQRDILQRDLKEQKRRLNVFQTAVEEWRKKESKRQADQARRTAEQSHPALRSMAEENARIAEARIATASGIERVRKNAKALTDLSHSLAEEFEDLRQKVEYAGATSSTGLLLRKKRDELPKLSEFVAREKLVHDETPRLHLQLMEWNRLQNEVVDPAEAANAAMAKLGKLEKKYGREQVLEVVTRIFDDRRNLLSNAIPDQGTYLQVLNDLELANQTLRADVDEFRKFLDQRILWMRSDEILEAEDFKQAASGIATLFSPTRWSEVVRVGCGDIARRPAIGLGVLALFALIVVFREKLLSVQKRLSQPPEAGEPASFVRYATAFAITFLVAIRWPILMIAIGFRLKLASGSSLWTQSVGDACLTTVVLLWGCELLREVARTEGIGEKLFRWPIEATRSIRRTFKATMAFGTPLLALLLLSQFGELAELESLHRILFIVTILLFVVQIGLLLSPRGRMMKAIAAEAPKAAIYRARYMVWLATTAAPGGFAVLSILGYHYSAYQLSGRLAETGAAIVAIIFLHALAKCWIEVANYNRSLSAPAAPVEAEVTQVESLISDDYATVQPQGSNDGHAIDDAHHEVRYFLQYATVALMMYGGWVIWSDVLPALHILDRVELWQNIESVAEKVTGNDGIEKIQITDHAVPTTLTDLLAALLVCIGTILLGRRLPGFLQLTFLDRLPFDQGGRQAIAILVRYVATLAGLLFACHIIRLSWSSVQWLLAAMTVGLGFGLQEIFANLVSGIIILFERPIRMGDLVTVDDITGNITKMQIRATTITDFDRRELIVPNKKFITDNVINWTLSDPISRVVLPVGVAYGTDIRRVEAILYRIARNCSFVMKEPAPSTLFKGFGDSTLDLELRVFIPKRDLYVDVVNQINKAIATEFKRAEIEIAFPQRDLHIKSYESIAVALTKDERGAA